MRFAMSATFWAASTAAGLCCEAGFVDVRSDNTAARFAVEVADTPAKQSRGLMFVEHMPRFEGMLFVNPEPRRATFWMKNTLIPLDMLFADETGTVTVLYENAVPHSQDTIDGGDGVKAVLEINGGLAKTLGLGVGTEIRHPAFNQETAAWPCEEQ